MLVELERHPKDAQGWSPYATSEYPLPPIIMFFRGKWVYLQYIYIYSHFPLPRLWEKELGLRPLVGIFVSFHLGWFSTEP